MSNTIRNAAIALAMLLPISAQAAPLPHPTAVMLAMDWARDWQAKDLDAVMSLYAPDIVWVNGDGTRVTGTAALRDFFATVLKQYSAKIYMHTVNGGGSSDIAYTSGDYSELITPVAAKGDKIAENGAYIIVVRHIGGDWRIAEQFWTQSVPVKIAR